MARPRGSATTPACARPGSWACRARRAGRATLGVTAIHADASRAGSYAVARRRLSAGSGELLCERLDDERAAVMIARPLPKLLAGELAVGLDHGPLAVRPAGPDRVQPRALARQAADQEAAAAPDGLDPAVVGRGPGPPPAADRPGGGGPDQGPGADALGGEAVGDPGEEGAGDAAPRPPRHEPQQHPLRPRQPQAVAGERLRLGIGGVRGEPGSLAVRRPGVEGRLGEAGEPDLVLEAGGPARPAPRQADQTVAATFLCA